MKSRQQQINELINDWKNNPRWKNVKRPYSAEEVVRLRGSVQPEYTLARLGAGGAAEGSRKQGGAEEVLADEHFGATCDHG